MFDTEEESAVLASLAELKTIQAEYEAEEEERDYSETEDDGSKSATEDDSIIESVGDESDVSTGRKASAGTACEGDIEDETTEDNDDSGKLKKRAKGSLLILSITGVQATPRRKRKRRKSILPPRKESYRRSKYYLMPDPSKIEDMPQNTYSRRVVKVQVTRVTETAVAEKTDIF